MDIKIVDTTLRDGEQTPGLAFSAKDKERIAKMLDKAGIYQIEAGIPAMDGEEKESVAKISQLGLRSKVSAWNRLNINDIRHSTECRPDIIHISAPSSDIQIVSKMKRERNWVIENLKRCICYAKEKGFEVTIGMEDASRAEIGFLLRLAEVAAHEGVRRVRYADTVGILHKQKVLSDISRIRSELGVDIEIHAHNDLGMAVANSIHAVRAGAEFVNCTIGGVGERTGNCNYLKFIECTKACFSELRNFDLKHAEYAQEKIMEIINVKTH
ncbi:MAG: homocitrate synthase [Bacillota bacterium]|nr:homocitrate synthase [Bacillota bacterium]